ncbi:hypothetical protein QFC21_002585 [Naganishia friedmannii]|uniref:Uncharacterized protein n=1 Tax=Naganishia friedmannii TaxID=89922 RepID=A0ACC2VUS8_9TREE|nr:hypothetical protein QFC21_002585 [Naganishia friedmannii]
MRSFKSSVKHYYGLVQYRLVLIMGILLAINYLHASNSVNTITCQSHGQAFYNIDGHRRTMETTTIAHAPGFTLFENAYWKNYAWYFVSSRPWAFPELTMVVTNVPDYDELPEMFHNDGLARVVTPVEMADLGLDLEDVEVLDGSTVSTVYHLVGEMFLGAWRVYTSVLVDPFGKAPQRTPQTDSRSILDQIPPISRFVFVHAPPHEVQDHAKLNMNFFDHVFPGIPFEFEDQWQARADSLKLFRFERVMIADRWSGHMAYTSKPMDYAFRLPAPSNWVSDLKVRMLANYQGPVSLKDPSHANSKPVITYLSRQEANHRKFNPETHEELIIALKALEEEGLAEVNVEEFSDADSKDEQVAKLSRTTILVGIHGNGLTNLIWMTPDAYGRSAVYEIQQPGMYTDDYAIISEALGIEHWIIGGRDEELE